jgi:NAD(P)-dependent dehydrogenase (short-subunit alcohol dehydrogenase family)
MDGADVREFAGRVAIVTGGGTGIGFALARAFLANGARVVIAGRRLEALEAAAQALGGEVEIVQADVSLSEDCERIVRMAVERFGAADILVNNAAHFAVQPLLEADEPDAAAFFGANVNGPLFCARAFASRIFARECRGAIVNISSIAGARSAAGCGLYSATKAALDSLTRTMALEWTSRGVRVNAVAPGHVETEGVIEDFRSGRLDEPSMMRRIPAGRIAAFEDIADAVMFLAGERSTAARRSDQAKALAAAECSAINWARSTSSGWPPITRQRPAIITRSARCAPQSASAAIGSCAPLKRGSSSL